MRWCLSLALLAAALVLAAAVKTDYPDGAPQGAPAALGLQRVKPAHEPAALAHTLYTSSAPLMHYLGPEIDVEAQGGQAVAAARAAGYDPGSQEEEFEYMVEQAEGLPVGVINPSVPAAANASSDGVSGWKLVWHALFLRGRCVLVSYNLTRYTHARAGPSSYASPRGDTSTLHDTNLRLPFDELVANGPPSAAADTLPQNDLSSLLANALRDDGTCGPMNGIDVSSPCDPRFDPSTAILHLKHNAHTTQQMVKLLASRLPWSCSPSYATHPAPWTRWPRLRPPTPSATIRAPPLPVRTFPLGTGQSHRLHRQPSTPAHLSIIHIHKQIYTHR